MAVSDSCAMGLDCSERIVAVTFRLVSNKGT